VVELNVAKHSFGRGRDALLRVRADRQVGPTRFMGSLHDLSIAHWGHERRLLARSPGFSRSDVLPPEGGTPCKNRFMGSAARFVGDFGRRIQHFEHPVNARALGLQGGVNARESLHLRLQRRQVGDEDQQAADAELAIEDMLRANDENDARAKRGHQSGTEVVDAAEKRGALLRRDGAVGVLFEPLLLALLLGEGLHDGNARQRLMNVRLEPVFNLALEPGGGAERLAQKKRRDDHERGDGQRQKCEPHVELQHQEHHQADREQRVAWGEDERVQHLVNAPTVGVDAAHRVADGRAQVEQEGTAL